MHAPSAMMRVISIIAIVLWLLVCGWMMTKGFNPL